MRLALIMAAAFLAKSLHGGSFIPNNDDFVLLRTSGAPLKPLYRRQMDIRMHVTNWSDAVYLAQQYLDRHRATGDGRNVGQAEACLRPWWNSEDAPVPVIFLRAEIRQRNHDFSNALAELDTVLQKEPNRAEALVLRTTILQVLGNYDAARSSAFRLIRVAPSLLAMATVADLGGLSGQSKSAFAMVSHELKSTHSTNRNELSWASTTSGQLALRSGNLALAEGYFQQALDWQPDDPYTLGVYADYLFDVGRPESVIPLLVNHVAHDQLLLRLAEAEILVRPKSMELKDHVTQLQSRFADGKLRGVSHGREESRFELHVMRSPRRALILAELNWKVQKEPVDAQILLESGLATGDLSAAAAAFEWARRYDWHGPALDKLLDSFPMLMKTAEQANPVGR